MGLHRGDPLEGILLWGPLRGSPIRVFCRGFPRMVRLEGVPWNCSGGGPIEAVS
jgi:hypothetical protein